MEAPITNSRRSPKGRLRWIVCGLLFLVTANNYFDRQIFGVIGPSLTERFGWQPSDYADMVTWFEVAYAIGFLVAGRFIDWVGTRVGFAIAVGALEYHPPCFHSGLTGMLGFKIARAALGFVEAAHLPGAIKVVAEWFPKEERALATGLYKAGGDVGAIMVPALIPWLYTAAGWRWTFFITGATGIVWLMYWIPFYRTPEDHKKISSEELAFIENGVPTAERKEAERLSPTPWSVLLREKSTYGYIAAKFLTDAIWHWYLYLLPLFLSFCIFISA